MVYYKVSRDRDHDAKKEFNSHIEFEHNLEKSITRALAHDLGNVLGSAKMSLSLLAVKSHIRSEHPHLFHILSKNLETATTMLSEFLEVECMICSGKIVIRPQPCCLRTLVNEALDLLTPTFGQRFKVFADDNIKGQWNAALLKRAIMNLASNGAKYGKADSTVSLFCHQYKTKTTIVVHNEGSQITDEDAKELFKPFCRLQSAKNTEGWGLGLAFVHSVISAHGGCVEVRSGDREGTNFIVTLPNESKKDSLASHVH